jgi:hypothetical protein
MCPSCGLGMTSPAGNKDKAHSVFILALHFQQWPTRIIKTCHTVCIWYFVQHGVPVTIMAVRLGNSGLKVSKIVLGCMSYGSSNSQPWILGEEEGLKQIKYAYDQGINTFDTANVRAFSPFSVANTDHLGLLKWGIGKGTWKSN